jgi:hypothetical protein
MKCGAKKLTICQLVAPCTRANAGFELTCDIAMRLFVPQRAWFRAAGRSTMRAPSSRTPRKSRPRRDRGKAAKRRPNPCCS